MLVGKVVFILVFILIVKGLVLASHDFWLVNHVLPKNLGLSLLLLIFLIMLSQLVNMVANQVWNTSFNLVGVDGVGWCIA